MAECAQSAKGVDVCWVSLDGYQTSSEVLIQKISSALGELPPARDFETLIGQLSSLPRLTWIMVDDFPRVASQDVDSFLAKLVNVCLPNVQWWITSRRRLRIGLAKLFMANELVEMDGPTLALGEQDLVEWLGQSAITTELMKVQRDTHGWMAAIALYLKLMDYREEASPRYQFDVLLNEYIEMEILSSINLELKKEIHILAVLFAFDDKLCAELINGPEGSSCLSELEGLGAFLLSIPDRPGWFRLMPALAALLSNELSIDEIRTIHMQACEILAFRGEYQLAIDHALAADQVVRAISLLEELANRKLLFGFQSDQLFRWLNALPASLRNGSCELVLLNAFAYVVTFQAKEARRSLEALRNFLPIFGADQQRRVIARAQAVEALLAHSNGQPFEAEKAAQEALGGLSSRDWAASLVCHTILINQALFSGTLAKAEEHLALTECKIKLLNVGVPSAYINIYKADLLMIRGEFRDAELLIENSIQELAGTVFQDRGWAGRLHLKLGQIQLRLGKFDAAEKRLWVAFSIMKDALEPAFYQALLGLCDLALMHGETNKAQSLLKETRELLIERSVESFSYLSPLELYDAKIALQNEHVTEARSLLSSVIQRHQAGQITQPMYSKELLYDCERLLASTEADFETSHQRLLALAHRAGSDGYKTVECDLLFTIARIAHEADEESIAKLQLTKALELASALSNRLPLEYLERRHPSLFYLVDRTSEADILSERECSILALVEAGMSNQEIGDALFISVYTVKSHLQRIFSKLSVKNRAHAISKARSLGRLV
ncbi:LuxR C-terminal-related transcriptional regulator [Halopseudomonas bauzanensis]|uniref:LuxR C-terminal-related transcriptional regulator n=1 Tax=Halopseudomonas bauzanensis TaxID=653930 RepID=UPI0025529D91|nr:LuxR C-terminal-related transcriptional regulator [Halopseudomonas bauzanensis]